MWRGRFKTPFVTPETDAPGTIARRVLVPANEQFAQLVTGALAELLQPENFTETPGGLSIEATVQRFHEMFTTYLETEGGSVSLPIGTILPHLITTALPSGWLPCDFSLHDAADYPALFAVLPDALKFGSTFRTPDLRNRVPVGQNGEGSAFGMDLGATGGDQEITLTTNQMPPHVHDAGQHSHILGNITVPGQTLNIPTTDNRATWTGGAALIPRHNNTNANGSVPLTVNAVNASAPSISQASIVTLSTGGGAPHSNLQPYTVTNYAIVALET
jgi:microcystin-dependent protein